MNSTFIRFLHKKEHLLSDIKQGFELRFHHIEFRPSLSTMLPSLISIWEDKSITSTTIQLILSKYNELTEDAFFSWFVQEMKANQGFNHNVSYLTSQVKSAQIKMKCFTELRDNQKIHPNHRHWFGNYGISLTKGWMKNNNGDRIIYVNRESEVTNRIGRVTSILFSALNGKDAIKSVFDILAFTEIEENSHEYEWRIVGNHNYAGKSYGDYPDHIKFTNDDILGIYVKDVSDIEVFAKALEEKKSSEGSLSIPQIYLSDEVFLTDEELREVENIYTRAR